MAVPRLVAVVGPVEPDLLRAFVEHYGKLGVTDFLLAFHFTEYATAQAQADVLSACRELIGPPVLVSHGPWHVEINDELRDYLRNRAGKGWHLIADVDEFQTYPTSLPETIAAAEEAGSPLVAGVLLDRVAADGSLRSWTAREGLDASYPLGGFLTNRVLGGDPNKLVLADASVPVGSGNHRSRPRIPVNDPLVPVHHFKWRAGVLADLEQRVREFTLGTWHEVSPAVRTEAGALLAHVQRNSGRIDVTDPRPVFRPVTLAETPAWWAPVAREVADRYEQYSLWTWPDAARDSATKGSGKPPAVASGPPDR